MFAEKDCYKTIWDLHLLPSLHSVKLSNIAHMRYEHRLVCSSSSCRAATWLSVSDLVRVWLAPELCLHSDTFRMPTATSFHVIYRLFFFSKKKSSIVVITTHVLIYLLSLFIKIFKLFYN